MEVSSSAVDTRWFQDRLADKRLSQRQLAKRMDLDPAAVSLMLRGKRKMSAAEAGEIARLLGVDVGDVLARAGSSPVVPSRQPDKAAPPVVVAPVKAADVQATMLELPVPMSDGSVARLLLPRNMTKSDAERICAIVGALSV